MLQEIKTLIHQLGTHSEVTFPVPFLVRLSKTHYDHMSIEGTKMEPTGEVFVMDGRGDWHKLDPDTAPGQAVAETLLNRLRGMAVTVSPTYLRNL